MSAREARPAAAVSAAAPADGNSVASVLPYLEETEPTWLPRALAAAALVHLAILLLPLPLADAVPARDEPAPQPFVVRTVRFQPPPVPPEPRPPRAEHAVTIPVPDPTPDLPEPVAELPPLPLPDLDLDALAVDVPAPPPAAAPVAAPAPSTEEPIWVGGDVARPRALHAPPPAYTEAARRTRTQGIVLLEVLLDRDGRVADVEVRRSLAMGLTESAVAAVSRWRYEPARVDGRAVPARMMVTVRFELQ